MSSEVLSIKLKSSLIKAFLSIFISLVLFGCSAQEPSKIERPELPKIEDSQSQPQFDELVVKAPWDVSTIEDEELSKLIAEKKIKEAIQLLQRKKQESASTEVYQQISSLYLKLGRSDDALSMISEFASINALQTEEIPAELTLIAAYSYKQKHDVDQIFAWFGVTLRKTSNLKTYQVAKQEVKNLLSRISDRIFSEYFIKWERDQSLSPLILEEQNRRRAGGQVVRLEETNFFSPLTYGFSGKEVPKAISPVTSSADAKLVILVPAKISRLAEEQKNAVQLALNSAVPPNLAQTQQIEQLTTAPKIVISIGVSPKKISENPNAQKAIQLSSSSIMPQLAEEIVELSKIVKDFQCADTYLVSDSTEVGASQLKPITVDELLQIASTKENAAEICVIGAFELDENVEKLTRVKARWPQMKLFGQSSWVDLPLLQTYKELFEGSIFITSFYAGSTRETVRDFMTGYQNSYGTEASYKAALSYDAAQIALVILGQKADDSSSYSMQSVTGIERFTVNIDKANSVTSGASRVSISERRFTRLMYKDGDLQELSSF